MNLANLIASDPNVDADFARLFAPRLFTRPVSSNPNDAAYKKRAPQRFLPEPEPPTGFGDIGTVGSERWLDVRRSEEEDQRVDERIEREQEGL